MDQLMCASLFPHPLMVRSEHVKSIINDDSFDFSEFSVLIKPMFLPKPFD